jgi:hypothetical protein
MGSRAALPGMAWGPCDRGRRTCDEPSILHRADSGSRRCRASRDWLLEVDARVGAADPSTPSTSMSGPAATAQAGRREAPEPGTCWRLSPSKFKPDYWYDDSPTVPCARRHNLETVLVYDLDKPTPENAQELFSMCFTQARAYVGSDLVSWVPWLAAMLLPSKEQVARGESWVRCDVAMYDDTSFHLAGSLRTGSVNDAVTDRRAAVWACTDKNLESGQGTVARFVDCGKPHLLEATGNLLLFDGLGSYPKQETFRAEEGPCRRPTAASCCP